MIKLRAIIKSFYKTKTPEEIYAVIEKSNLFDREYYRRLYGCIKPYDDEIKHYISIGHSLFYDPSPYFSTSYYLYSNIDVKTKGINSFYHYIKYGEKEGRKPNPLFDPKVYLSTNEDLKSWNNLLLEHFIKYGRNENRTFFCAETDKSDLYGEWISKIEDNSVDNKFVFRPKISIVVPVYNPPIKHLVSCVESVLNQTYDDWELILVNDCSTDTSCLKYLKSINHDKIKVINNKKNKHISISTNNGISQAKGEYIGLLDHDDVLAPEALSLIVNELNKNRGLKWIYTDEDFIDEEGTRLHPHFKTDFNPYLLRSHNYITHFCIFQREILIELGGCRPGFEGAQDFDLALRMSEKISNEEIMHIPKILYHWRMHSGSTAKDSTTKPYTIEKGKKALEDHLVRVGIKAKVDEANIDNYFHVSYIPNSRYPKVSIIIPTKNQRNLLEKCIGSILEKTEYDDYEIIIMNNQSTEIDSLEYIEQIKEHCNIKVIDHNKEFNYSEINNVGVKYASGEVIVLLNNDVEVISTNWLKELVGLAVQNDVGCVGAKLLYEDNTIQHAGIILGLGGYAAHSHRKTDNSSYGYFNRPHVNQAISAVTGACLAIKKETYLSVGGLDEEFEVAYNDVDFCLRVSELGLYNVYCAGAVLYHYESKTRGDDNLTEEKRKRFNKEKQLLLSRWKRKLDNDPFYNINLTRDSEDFSIRTKIY